jgi:adenine phosphoribosyltransferase
MILHEIYKRARVVSSGRYLTTVNEFCDQVPALRPRVLWEAALEVARRCPPDVTKLLGEEDKGAPLLTAVSLITGIPMCMARWYKYELGGEQSIEIQSEYYDGHLYVNGLERGDRVVIIEDTISTGGTLVGLIGAVQQAGAVVAGAIALVEKTENRGVRHVYEATGVAVTTVLKIAVRKDGVEIIDPTPAASVVEPAPAPIERRAKSHAAGS